MRNVCRLLLLFIVLAVTYHTSATQTVWAQEKGGQQQGSSIQGTLVKVDSDAKTLTVKAADNKDVVFRYTEKTEVVGAPDIQGLAGKSGTKVNVTFTAERGGAPTAMRIEMLRE